MDEMKALPAPSRVLALPNYSGPSGDYIDEELIADFINDLKLLASERAAEITAERTFEEDDRKYHHFLKSSVQIPVLDNWLEGFALAFSSYPIRKVRPIVSDAQALRGDLVAAFEDAARVWRTIEVFLPKTRSR